jgi:spermidine synthase
MRPSWPTSVLVCASLALAGLWPASARAQTAPAAPDACGTEDLIAGKTPWGQQELRGNAALVTDGSVAPEGAVWDAPLAVVLGSSKGSLTYDLGQPRTISALYLQADANDSYRVLGSANGAAGSYRPLAELQNVVARGHGLRARFVEIPPVQARYLRIGEAYGDGFYSISELAVYCRAPRPFPPAMRVLAATLAPSPRVAQPWIDSRQRESNVRRGLLLLVAAALALLGLGSALLARRNRRRSAASYASKSAAARGSEHAQLRLMFVASGCAALIYEIVWFHLLRLVIGASALSVGIVLASFMGGMFLGSLLFARLVSRQRNPLRVYAALEIGIGVFGLLMPLMLPFVRLVYLGLVGYGALGIALRALVAAVLLLPPTALMGATLPAVARRYAHTRRGTSGLAALYAANTFGAVIGCLLSGFYLLASWDVWVTTFVAAALNFAIGGYALLMARRAAPDEHARAVGSQPTALAASAQTPGSARVVYFAIALSGMTALGAQVVWTRLLTLLFGATVYAFAIILAVFLAGLGLGGSLASHLLRRGLHPLRGLFVSQIALVPALLLSGMLLADVLPYASPSAMTPVRPLHMLHMLRALDVILPAAVLWGMSFPFALAAAAARQEDAGRSSGRVYAANTFGAIVGALAVSFWAIPRFGTHWAEQALVVASAISAAVLIRALRGTAQGALASLRSVPTAWVLASGVLAAALLPGLSTVFLAHGRHIWWIDPRDEYPYVSEGAASTVAVHIAADGSRNFHVSGRVEASNNPNDLRLERLLGHLSALVHPRPESVLVVGLGAGITAGALSLHPEVKHIVICEIEPRVVGAAQQFAAENYAVLSDPRVRVIFDDARHFLATTQERFDVITSDPIHPWVRGNSVLFSREYYALVRARLRPGGIATQWVPLYDTSEEAIKIQMRTFTEAFPNGSVWNSAITGRGYDVVLLGQTAARRLDVQAIQRRIDRTARITASLQEVKIFSAVDLLATYGVGASDMKSWVAGTPVNRDFSLKLEYISGLALNEQNADAIYAGMVAHKAFPEGLFAAPADTLSELRRRILANTPAPR